jgi:hypothetical protein
MDYAFNVHSDRKYMILGSIGTIAVLIAVLFMVTKHMVITYKQDQNFYASSTDGNPTSRY